MKIVYYLPALYAPGGLERIITFKANYFADHLEGYEIYILTSEQIGRPIYYNLSPKVKHIDLNVPFDWPFNQSRINKLLKYPYHYLFFLIFYLQATCYPDNRILLLLQLLQ